MRRLARPLLALCLVQALGACSVLFGRNDDPLARDVPRAGERPRAAGAPGGAARSPAAGALGATAARPELAPELAAALRALAERRLMVPVAGVAVGRVPDTFYQPRGGGRVHYAVDILAPKGTPVLSADDGRVLRLRSNSAGGITVYAVDSGERFVYYYAHLDRYRDGLTEGTKVAKGEVLGYVGTTGNAPKNTPHLHFQVMRLDGPPSRWWEGTPLDPRPHFAMDGAQR